MSSAPQRRANVIGLGLIGGSIALALQERGWTVSGDDAREPTLMAALERGVIDATGLDQQAEITFVAVPVLAVGDQVKRALAETTGFGDRASEVSRARCVVRTMTVASSAGTRWPEASSTASTVPSQIFSTARSGCSRRSKPVTMQHLPRSTASSRHLAPMSWRSAPEHHDQLVAVVSHVPHLTAATLMGMASERAEEHAALLRLAAGGFRDMTRVASGQPDIWIDICSENKVAIMSALDGLIAGLSEIRDVVAVDDHDVLRARLQAAREARTNLPSRVVRPEDLAEVRIPIPDRAGAAAEVFTLAAELGVNIANFEVVHLAESNRGVAVVLIDETTSEVFRGGLIARGFRPSVQALS